MSVIAIRSDGIKRREHRNTITGGPPWSSAQRDRLVKRVRIAVHTRAKKLDIRPLGPILDFVGYGGADLIKHLERRHLQGCLVCGNDLAPGEPFEICHIDPLAGADDAGRLAALMQLSNIGLAHVDCNVRLGARPVT